MSKAGYYRGHHYTEYVEDIESLKKDGKDKELEKLLLGLVKAVEAESRKEGYGVAPFYYTQLAVLYRKQKRYDAEVSILERFAKQKHAPGAGPAQLLKRLDRAKELAEKAKGQG